MSEKLFDFGVDIPTKITKYTKRFTDLEGFLDEDYDGEHHMLWDNQDECWICLDDVLCLMEDEYVNIKEENEQLLRYKYFVKAVEVFTDCPISETIADYSGGELFDEEEQLEFGKKMLEQEKEDG